MSDPVETHAAKALPFDVEKTLSIIEGKRDSFLSHLPEINTLVVGSSHGDYGFDPRLLPGSFNFCVASQDLYYSKLLYDWAVGRCDGIDTIIVFYSIFSYGFSLALSAERAQCILLRHALHLPWPESSDSVITRIAEKLQLHSRSNLVSSFRYGFIPSNDRWFIPPGYLTATQRAIGHWRRSEAEYAGADQLVHLIDLMRSAKRQSHNLIVVVPPARSDYVAELPVGRPLFDKVKLACAEHKIPFLNLLGDPSFRDEYFGDFDHLLPVGTGPIELARQIRLTLTRTRLGKTF